jgi:flagellin
MINELSKEFSRINTDTEFNKKKLLGGSYSSEWLQVGANSGQGIAVSIAKISWSMTSLSGTGSTDSKTIAEVDKMISSVTIQRSKLGAIQNRLEMTVNVDDNTAENLQSAESRIRDTDMADEMTRYSKESILQQAATSMLAQANQANQGVLSLLG